MRVPPHPHPQEERYIVVFFVLFWMCIFVFFFSLQVYFFFFKIKNEDMCNMSSKFGVYEFLVFRQIPACNSMLFFLSIIGRLSMFKSIYLSNQKQGIKVLYENFRCKLDIRKLQMWSSLFSTEGEGPHHQVHNWMKNIYDID
jgi:hypothetical protein